VQDFSFSKREESLQSNFQVNAKYKAEKKLHWGNFRDSDKVQISLGPD
jgi:hypothetical protein